LPVFEGDIHYWIIGGELNIVGIDKDIHYHFSFLSCLPGSSSFV